MFCSKFTPKIIIHQLPFLFPLSISKELSFPWNWWTWTPSRPNPNHPNPNSQTRMLGTYFTKQWHKLKSDTVVLDLIVWITSGEVWRQTRPENICIIASDMDVMVTTIIRWIMSPWACGLKKQLQSCTQKNSLPFSRKKKI